MRAVRNSLRHLGLTSKPKKCATGQTTLWYSIWGYINVYRLGKRQVRPQTVRTAAIKSETPDTKKGWGSTWCWFCSYVPNYSVVTSPLTGLNKKKAPDPFQWTEPSKQVKKGSILGSTDIFTWTLSSYCSADWIIIQGLGTVLSQVVERNTNTWSFTLEPKLYITCSIFCQHSLFALRKLSLSCQWFTKCSFGDKANFWSWLKNVAEMLTAEKVSHN